MSINLFANSLKNFETDGCTGFVDGTPKEPKLWAHCCLMHDMKYWYGGAIESRDKADIDLKACVKEVAGDNWAELIYQGVRAGHHSPIKSKYVWSWGWEEKRPLTKLNLKEKAYVIFELNRLPYNRSEINRVISESF